jgi:hypothetical protein
MLSYNPFSNILQACAFLCALGTLLQAQTSPTQPPQSNQSKEPPVKLFEPYPPKPSSDAPPGWEIHILEGSVIENVTVLRNKREIKVTVPAYELVPVAIKGESFTISKDPGFDPTQGTTQTNTIGAILANYIDTITNLQTALETTIQELETTLKSIPPKQDITTPQPPPKSPESIQPTPQPTPSPTPAPTTPTDVKPEPTPTPPSPR